ncbi:MAG: RidA family protein [Gammaproteobacteria bacterium]|nr:RidA family protein [Gammaproteobacteria bacterium]
MDKTPIQTAAAPQAIGAYSQAIRAGTTVYLSGQIPLAPTTMELVSTDIHSQIEQVFENLKAVASASGCTLADAAKLTVYLTDLTHFPAVNEMMTRYFTPPYPARATVQVAALPRGALVEIDAILVS